MEGLGPLFLNFLDLPLTNTATSSWFTALSHNATYKVRAYIKMIKVNVQFFSRERENPIKHVLRVF